MRAGIFDLIQKEYADFGNDSCISIDELNLYRRQYLTWLISQEKGELISLHKDVLHSIKSNSILSENIQEDIEAKLSVGQKMADRIASFFMIFKHFVYSLHFQGHS